MLTAHAQLTSYGTRFVATLLRICSRCFLIFFANMEGANKDSKMITEKLPHIFFREINSHNEIKNFLIKSEDRKVVVKSSRGSALKNRLSIRNLTSMLRNVFLPEGFPHSVHPDYVPYQIWDTIQAFASTILSTLTTHSILQSVGVGESTATPLAATISWIMKDGTGMIGRIVFTWRSGNGLDAQCKKWRLLADILNDIAMGIELMLPYFSSSWTMIILCVSTAMKSIVGVAGGATRAALIHHQALANNLADVSAKDGSQETFVNLVASFVGIFLLSFIQSSWSIFLYMILVAIHIFANYSALRSLQLNSLNEDRLALILDSYMVEGRIQDVDRINRQESLSFFHKSTKKLCGFDIALGVSIAAILENKNLADAGLKYIEKIVYHHRSKKYLIFPDIKRKKIYVALNETIQPLNVLEAFFDAYFYAMVISTKLGNNKDIIEKRKFSTISPFAKHYRDVGKNPNLVNYDKNRLVLQTIDTFQSLIAQEFEFWQKLLDKSDWIYDTNLLSVGSWRANWNQYNLKE